MLAARNAVATAAVFIFFPVLPHAPVGMSKVHLILGATLFLMLGVTPSAIGLVQGLLVQGLLFEPADLPQYGRNVTTLLGPLVAQQMPATRVIARDTAYVDLTCGPALALSTAYQGGFVAWVAFRAIWGQGMTPETLTAVSTFAAASMLVLALEPLVDLALPARAKAKAKARRGPKTAGHVNARVFGIPAQHLNAAVRLATRMPLATLGAVEVRPLDVWGRAPGAGVTDPPAARFRPGRGGVARRLPCRCHALAGQGHPGQPRHPADFSRAISRHRPSAP